MRLEQLLSGAGGVAWGDVRVGDFRSATRGTGDLVDTEAVFRAGSRSRRSCVGGGGSAMARYGAGAGFGHVMLLGRTQQR